LDFVQFGGFIEQNPTILSGYHNISSTNQRSKYDEYILWYAHERHTLTSLWQHLYLVAFARLYFREVLMAAFHFFFPSYESFCTELMRNVFFPGLFAGVMFAKAKMSG